RLGRFLTAMDAKAITSLSVSVILLIFVVLMFFYGQRWLHLNDEATLATYAGAGITRAILRLPSEPREAVLPLLDRHAKLIQ
ncbi:MAG: hypothetical protein AABZ83_09585, partial [candidate division NC10 bacterium]